MQRGVLDLGPVEQSSGPSQQGLLDLGLSRESKGPTHEGLLEVGRYKIVGPCTRGGCYKVTFILRILIEIGETYALHTCEAQSAVASNYKCIS